jgi:hypothetical protein
VVLQGLTRGVILVAATIGIIEELNKPGSEVVIVKPAAFSHGLQQEKGGIAIVRLVTRLFALMVVTRTRCFESCDAPGVESGEL